MDWIEERNGELVFRYIDEDTEETKPFNEISSKESFMRLQNVLEFLGTQIDYIQMILEDLFCIFTIVKGGDEKR